jgi:hypothetical protein
MGRGTKHDLHQSAHGDSACARCHRLRGAWRPPQRADTDEPATGAVKPAFAINGNGNDTGTGTGTDHDHDHDANANANAKQ